MTAPPLRVTQVLAVLDRHHVQYVLIGGYAAMVHGALKQMVSPCAFVVRTGEATPYANVILRAGVPF